MLVLAIDADKKRQACKSRKALAMAFLLNAFARSRECYSAFQTITYESPGELAHQVIKLLEIEHPPKDTSTEVEVQS